MPCCYDALSAKMIEQAGFELSFMSGFATSAAKLGLPDTGLISYGEVIEQGRNICENVNIPIIGDAKRGDIGNTAKQYAASIFGHFGFDSVTLSPYMGEDSIMPFLNNEEKGVFILCRTSNPSAKTFQSLNFHDEVKLYEQVAKWADSLNVNDNVGLVVGATAPEELIKVRRLAPSLPILIPGIGAQGGDLVSCIKEGNKSGIGILNISRDISFSGSHSANDIRQSAKMYVKKMNEALNV